MLPFKCTVETRIIPGISSVWSKFSHGAHAACWLCRVAVGIKIFQQMLKRTTWNFIHERSAWLAGVEASIPMPTHGRTFFWLSKQGYPHPGCLELGKSRIRVMVGDCSDTERRPWRPPYQIGKTLYVPAKHTTHWGCVPDMISYAGTVVTLNNDNNGN